jgi:type II secretory pathway component PulF
MNYDEFAFFNQQLAAMLRDGIPLEGALKQLSAGMRSGPLREEVAHLESDLVGGTPLTQALAKRRLPEFYRRMLEVGVRGNDLPGVLTLLADHYHRANSVWTRLKGLLVYPVIVVIVSFGLSFMLSATLSSFTHELYGLGPNSGAPYPGLGAGPGGVMLLGAVWMPPTLLALLVGLGAAGILVPNFRARLRWRLPAFREASLAELASAMALVLKNGMTLSEALALAETLESHTPADAILAQWRSLVETGRGKPSQWPAVSRPIPPLFLWLVQQGGEDVAGGFQKAADIYYARASYRIELALYGALPVSVLLLGQMVLWQVLPMMRAMVNLMNAIGG